MRKMNIIAICFLFLLGIFFYFSYKKPWVGNTLNTSPRYFPAEEEKGFTKKITIESGDVFATVMEKAQVPTSTWNIILQASQDIYDFSNIRADKTIFFTYEKKTNDLVQLMYPINDLEELYVKKDTSTSTPDIWSAERKKINYEIKLKTFKGEISTFLYQDALTLGINEGTVLEFAEIFEYAIDYAYDIRVGDKFQFVVEERYRDGKYVMPGRVLAGKFVNASTTNLAYYFEENDDNMGYFDDKGRALQKMFLRAPVAFRYISSGFTTGLRYIQAFNISTGHRAIDYATPAGTPIRATADGTVIFAGWSRAGYGYLTSVRHNSTYSTNYAHQSRIIVKRGQRVKQGQIIGYVGSTGLSTGPHLHYELVKNGVKVNPLREVMPLGKPIKNENVERFYATIEPFQKMLNQQ